MRWGRGLDLRFRNMPLVLVISVSRGRWLCVCVFFFWVVVPFLPIFPCVDQLDEFDCGNKMLQKNVAHKHALKAYLGSS